METRAEFEHFTQLAFNKPFMLKVTIEGYKSVSRNGSRHFLYACEFNGEKTVLSLPKRLHELLLEVDANEVYVYSHTEDDKYHWDLHYEYFKNVVYDIVTEDDYKRFYSLT